MGAARPEGTEMLDAQATAEDAPPERLAGGAPAADLGAGPPVPRPPPLPERREADEATRARELQLVARIRRGDERAFAELVRGHQDRVFDLLFRMIGDREEAEDLAQEVFVAVHGAVGKFRGESRLSTWIFRVAKNHCLNRIKYLGRRGKDGRNVNLEDAPELADLDEDQEEKRPDRILEQRQVASLLKRAMAELSEEHRLLVVLRDVEGLSYEEIMDITDQPEGTVKSRLHRARAHLATIVAKLQAEEGKGAR